MAAHHWQEERLRREPQEDGWTLVLEASCLVCGARAAFRTAGACCGRAGGSVEIVGVMLPEREEAS